MRMQSPILAIIFAAGLAFAEPPVERRQTTFLHSVGKPLRLAPKGRSGLGSTYEWTWISRPTGSNASFVNPTARSTSFIPDVRGNYVAAMTVRQGEVIKATETVTVAASPNAPFRSLNTRVVKNSGTVPSDFCIDYDGQEHCGTGTSTSGMLVLVVDRTTAEVVESQTLDTSQGQKPFTDYLSTLGPTRLLIATTLVDSGPSVNTQAAPTLEAFGANQDFRNVAGPLVYSFIGVQYTQAGQAWQVSNEALVGSLVPDSQANFTFVQFDFVQFSLFPSSDPAVPATIQIGSQAPIASVPKTGALGGFVMVNVDRARLSTTSPDAVVKTYYTLDATPELSIAAQQALATDISSVRSSQDRILFLTTFGAPHNGAWAPDFAVLASYIDQIGGVYESVLTINSGQAYSLVAAMGSGSAVESSSLRTPQMPQGILRGVLGRGRQGNWYDVVSSSLTRSSDLDLYTIAGQAPQAWPVPVTPGQQAAYSYIGKQLCGSCTDLRFAYNNTNIPLAVWASQLVALPVSAGSGFSADDFSAVRSQLLKEFGYVAAIQNFETNLSSLWTDQQANFSLIATAVASDVKSAIQPPPASLFSKFLSGVFEGAITVAEDIVSGGLAGVIKDEVKLVLPQSVVQAVLTLGVSLAKDAAGNTAEATPDIDSTVANLERKTAYQLGQHLASLGVIMDIMVSDWGKVQALGQKLNNPNDPQWSWNGSLTTGKLLQNLTVGMEQNLYRTLMKDIFNVKQWVTAAQFEPDPGKFNHGNDLIPNHPWTNWPQEAWTTVDWTGVDTTNNQSDFQVVWLDRNGFNKSTVPPVLRHLYAPSWQGGLGVYKPALLRRWGLDVFNCHSSTYACE